MLSKLNKVNFDEFKNIISSSFYMVDVLERLGYGRNCGSMSIRVINRCKKENIDTSHFIGQKGRKTPRKPTIELKDILIENSKYENITRLKIRLLKEGLIKNVCYECGQEPFWNNKPLIMVLDHKNGKHTDNRLLNLRMLCPNCNSQTSTFAGRNIKLNNIALGIIKSKK